MAKRRASNVTGHVGALGWAANRIEMPLQNGSVLEVGSVRRTWVASAMDGEKSTMPCVYDGRMRKVLSHCENTQRAQK